MAAIDDVAQALARETGQNADEIKTALRGVSDEQVEALAQAADSPLRERAALTAVDRVASTPQNVGEAAADSIGSTGRYIGAGTGLAGLGIGGGVAYNAQKNAEQNREDNQTVREIWNDPNLSADDKLAAIRRLSESGVIGSGGGGGGGGPLGAILGDAAPGNQYVQWAIILLGVYFAGKTVNNYVAAGGGSGA